MKHSRIVHRICLAVVVFGLSLVSCNRSHYNLDYVNGVQVEGEALLPLVSGSYSIMDLMQRFQIDSLLDFDASGNMSYDYSYEHYGIVKGEELLRFNDLRCHEHFTYPNPNPQVFSQPLDTMVSYMQTLTFEAEHISVMTALMRSGRFDFALRSNIGAVRRVVIRSLEIRDAQGHTLELDLPVNDGAFGFDLDGLRYATLIPNTLHLVYELYFTVQSTTEPELYLDIDIAGSNLAIREMTGYVERYGIHSNLDTTFCFLPDNVSGTLDLNDVSVRLCERNTFGLGARLVVDTADIICEDVASYSLFHPIPLVIDMPTQMTLGEIHHQTVSGEINAKGGRAYVASDFIINPEGESRLFVLSDTCEIDFRVDVGIPMASRSDEVRYLDTVDMQLEKITTPEWVKKLTLEITFTSTIPFDLHGSFMAYDTVSGMVADVLLDDAEVIAASYDGQPNKSTIAIEITEEKLMSVIHANKLILDLRLDTDGNDVRLNANQSLDYFVKARVVYDGILELEKE